MKVIIVGGGVAGLAAAVALTKAGHTITLFEARSFCGGRAYSFREPKSQELIDNGQHLLMGCYRSTFDYLRTIGADALVRVEPKFHVAFLDDTGRHFALDCPTLPPPLHLLAGLARLQGFAWGDLFRLIRRANTMRSMCAEQYAMWDQWSVSDWLDSAGQSAAARRLLWEPLTLAVMNETMERSSAAPLLMMLNEGACTRGVPLGLAFPRTGLSPLLVDPAIAWLQGRGAVVQTGAPITSIDTYGDQMAGVTLRNGETHTADAYIVALPPRELHRLIETSGAAAEAPWSRLTEWESVPILSVHLWHDRQILPQPMVGLVGSRFHWAFDKTALRRPSSVVRIADEGGIRNTEYGQRFCIALVSSACREAMAWSRAETIAVAQEALARYCPSVKGATLQHAQVTKELHATVSVAKGSASRRLTTTTPWANVYVAGDWTQTYLPATIEGAVRSGYAAAKLVSF